MYAGLHAVPPGAFAFPLADLHDPHVTVEYPVSVETKLRAALQSAGALAAIFPVPGRLRLHSSCAHAGLHAVKSVCDSTRMTVTMWEESVCSFHFLHPAGLPARRPVTTPSATPPAVDNVPVPGNTLLLFVPRVDREQLPLFADALSLQLPHSKVSSKPSMPDYVVELTSTQHDDVDYCQRYNCEGTVVYVMSVARYLTMVGTGEHLPAGGGVLGTASNGAGSAATHLMQ